MEIGNKISQLFGKDDVSSSKEFNEEKSSNDREISIFNRKEDREEESNNIETNDVDKQGFFDKIKSLFKKENKEEVGENQTINQTTSTTKQTAVENPKPVEQVSNVKMYDSNTINGEIDEKFSQGHTGDCVLLSTILALSYTDKGAEMIKNSISTNTNSNGEIESYSVTFPGIKETYTISKQELEEREYDAVNRKRMSDEELVEILGFTEKEVKNMKEEDKWFETHALNSYSNGDSDVLLLELATEKCFNESDNTFVKAYISATMDARKGTEHSGYNVLNLEGIPPQLLSRMLTGDSHIEEIKNQTQLLEKINIGSPIIMNTGNKTVRIPDINNNEIELDSTHAYAVKTATNDTITIVNPHDSSIELTFNKDDLLNLDGVGIQAYNLK